jgi:hypothetical protein
MMGPGRELLRIGCNPRYGRPKMRDHVRRMSVIPVDRLSEVGAGGLSKGDAPHSSRLSDKLAVDALPGSSAFGVVVKGRDAAIKLALLRGSQLNLLCGEATSSCRSTCARSQRRSPAWSA